MVPAREDQRTIMGARDGRLTPQRSGNAKNNEIRPDMMTEILEAHQEQTCPGIVIGLLAIAQTGDREDVNPGEPRVAHQPETLENLSVRVKNDQDPEALKKDSRGAPRQNMPRGKEAQTPGNHLQRPLELQLRPNELKSRKGVTASIYSEISIMSGT